MRREVEPVLLNFCLCPEKPSVGRSTGVSVTFGLYASEVAEDPSGRSCCNRKGALAQGTRSPDYGMTRLSQARKKAARIAFRRWYRKYGRAYGRAYRQRPKVKARRRAYGRVYRHRPEVKARQRAYNRKHRKQIRRWQRAYRQRPDVKARHNARRRAWWLAHRDDPKRRAKRRAYLQRPHIKAKLRLYQRAYRKTRKWKAWKRAYAVRPDVKARQRIHMRNYCSCPIRAAGLGCAVTPVSLCAVTLVGRSPRRSRVRAPSLDAEPIGCRADRSCGHGRPPFAVDAPPRFNDINEVTNPKDEGRRRLKRGCQSQTACR
jgi:hypothetical protein